MGGKGEGLCCWSRGAWVAPPPRTGLQTNSVLSWILEVSEYPSSLIHTHTRHSTWAMKPVALNRLGQRHAEEAFCLVDAATLACVSLLVGPFRTKPQSFCHFCQPHFARRWSLLPPSRHCNYSASALMHACLLSRFSCVQRFATPWTVASQVLLFMGFSRQKYWNELPFPSPGDLPHPRI